MQLILEEKKRWLIPLSVIVALVLTLILGIVVRRIYVGGRDLLQDVSFGAAEISPNADGDNDITRIDYTLTRGANISIYFENEAGERFYFRDSKPRAADEYSVFFSGIVDGFKLPDETIDGEIIDRLLPDGPYRWVIEATEPNGTMAQVDGELLIANGDSALPEMRDFGVDKTIFTPNRDGVSDRIQIQYDLQKESNVRVYLQLPSGGELPIGETERAVPAGEPGRHYYDYEGGVDNGETPPEDGIYEVVAIAEDTIGQKIRVSDQFEIRLGGVPRAEIFSPPAGDTFEVSATAIQLCETLFFTVTVENYGTTPIRTTGPEPGTVYDSTTNYNSLGWHTESGAWRVAVGFENELSNYPYRWAVGNDEVLEEIDGFQYLMPGDRALVTGGIRLVGPLGERNPQPVWAGLIHEDVEISSVNNRVDPKSILIDLPDPANIESCE